MKSLKIKLPFFAIFLMIPLYTYSSDSLILLERCKGHINSMELVKSNGNVTSLEDPIIKLSLDGNFCVGYIHGFLDAQSSIQEKKYCLPYPIDTYQIAKVYSKYLEEHPEKLHQNSNITFSEALISYFPCKN
ncbi:TPA: hypothetical protein RG395_001046 [Legionella pneumophila]|uniref:Rap1a immunity protein domain-containing protein n=1 Tax=Legionella pneumophila TaxID=446 RepID=A0AAN5T9H8_LEGPN|nr:Rap1a/Tai family immunity protein [Legionella pneumophila]TIH05328.1 hypothetical protein DI137_00005 [Legionella pneumophila]VEB31302.1 Uncharacterised protein [Legionella pneumophila]HAT1942727.1 hypothetical protein [Legionella pneumophila]HAT3856431.1 hypothetical protein [Legionella pneumophila]HAT3862035.1 hypothetical protein [Legionella pneumophila]